MEGRAKKLMAYLSHQRQVKFRGHQAKTISELFTLTVEDLYVNDFRHKYHMLEDQHAKVRLNVC